MLRILCLPGWRTSAKFMRAQLSFSLFTSKFKNDIEFVPIDPTFPASGPPQNLIRAIDPEGPYFQWWYIDDTSLDPICAGVDQTVTNVANFLKKEGPFDGILGFSQGAAAALYLAILQESGDPRLQDQFSFIILIAGFHSNCQEIAQKTALFKSIPIPSLHIIGSKDAICDLSKQVAETYFTNKVIILHEEGHKLPRAEGKVLEALKKFFDTRAQLSAKF